MAGGPMMRPSIQMEKKMAFIPPSFMRGMSMLPSALRFARSKSFEKNRCVVSSWVSRTMDEKWSLRARSAISSALVAAIHSEHNRKKEQNDKNARRRISSSLAPLEFGPNQKCRVEILPYQPAEHGLFPCLAIYFRDGFRQGNFLWTSLEAIMRVGAILNTTGMIQRADAIVGVHRSGWMHVEKTHLADDCGADKISGGRAGDLGTHFQAIAAGNAGGEFVCLFLGFRRDARAFAKIVSPVDRNPRLDALQAFEHELAIDGEVAHDWKFRHRLKPDGLFQLVDQRGAGHARLSIDQHGAGAADFFQAIGIVGDGSGLFSAASDGIFRDVAQTDDYVHCGAPGQREFFPVRRALRAHLPLNFYDDLFLSHSPCQASYVEILRPAFGGLRMTNSNLVANRTFEPEIKHRRRTSQDDDACRIVTSRRRTGAGAE